MAVSSENVTQSLVERYSEALKDSSKMKNWRRSLTRYCTTREEKTGTPAIRFRAAVKSRLTKLGYDTSNV